MIYHTLVSLLALSSSTAAQKCPAISAPQAQQQTSAAPYTVSSYSPITITSTTSALPAAGGSTSQGPATYSSSPPAFSSSSNAPQLASTQQPSTQQPSTYGPSTSAAPYIPAIVSQSQQAPSSSPSSSSSRSQATAKTKAVKSTSSSPPSVQTAAPISPAATSSKPSQQGGTIFFVPLSNSGNLEYTAQVAIAGGIFNLQLDTGSSDLWVRGPNCQSSDTSCSGVKLNTSNSTLTATGKDFSLGYGSGTTSGQIFIATVNMGGVVAKMPIGSATSENGMGGADGILGLGYEDISFISSALSGQSAVFTDNANLQSKVFTFWMGTEGVDNNQGIASFGGIPPPGTTYNLPITYFQLSEKSYWEFDITGATFTVGTNGASTPLITKVTSAIADSGTSLIALEDDRADALNAQIGATYSSGLYTLPCTAKSGPPVIFNLAAGKSFSIPASVYVLGSGTSCISGFGRGGGGGFIILGDTFIRAFFTIFDLDNGQVGFAPAIHASASLEEESAKCARIIDHFSKPEDQKLKELIKSIPSDVIKNSKGIAIMSVVKAGLVWTGKAGSGLILAHLEGGQWSAPSAIWTVGSGVGWQFGAELTDIVMVLNTQEAVEAFFSANVTLGGNVTVAAGPYGRSAEVAGAVTKKLAAIYSYSNSQGLFAGMSLEGSVILERHEANEKFYKEKVSAKDLLSGFVPKPAGAAVLYEALAKHCT